MQCQSSYFLSLNFVASMENDTDSDSALSSRQDQFHVITAASASLGVTERNHRQIREFECELS
jgi:hypothetical protein